MLVVVLLHHLLHSLDQLKHTSSKTMTRVDIPNWCLCLVLIWVPAVFIIPTVEAARQATPATPTEKIDGLGVNWGALASHQMLPSIVVDMLKANGIKKVKLFDADSWTVSALSGTGIEVMVAIPNNQLGHFAGRHYHAKDWVSENITKHIYAGGVDIKYVAVGNEAFLKAYNGSFLHTLYPAMANIQRALKEAGHTTIKVTTPLNADVYDTANDKPSGGNFRSDIRDLMVQIVNFLHENDAPFVVNIYPFLSLYQNEDFPVDYAFFGGGAKPTYDNGIEYTNVFDANYDTLVWSLKQSGVPNLKILVGEVGWPTDGDKHATVDLAKKFYDGFLKKMAAKEGTPLRHGPLNVYLFSLNDEDMKSIAPGSFERHWGIFRYDGKPKFPMDLTGQGHDQLLVEAKGVRYLPQKWCVLKPNVNPNHVAAAVTYACALSDCTSLGYGSSCNNLNRRGNVSYAFNMHFQMQDQDVQACDFNGVATITKVNASQDGCLFPIQIESAGVKMKMGIRSNVLLLLMVLVLM